jgi:hypothetical protein
VHRSLRGPVFWYVRATGSRSAHRTGFWYCADPERAAVGVA